jgi:uncharacterized protein (TIGR02996 family)
MSEGRDADIEGELLRDICERPDDDAPRLAYADWLEARSTRRSGDPNYDRARFIRAQCERERLPREDPQRVALDRIADQLLLEHWWKWARPFNAWSFSNRENGITYRRGFPAEVSLSEYELSNERMDQLFRFAPITGIRIDLGFHPEQITALAALPHLLRLTKLDLGGSDIGPEGAVALANSPHLNNLSELYLSSNNIGDEGAQALASSPHLGNLRSLGLADNSIGDTGAQALAAFPHLRNLTTLGLDDNRIGPAGVEALTNSPHLSGLLYLYVTENNIGDHWLKEISRRLAVRRLGGHEIDPRG